MNRSLERPKQKLEGEVLADKIAMYIRVTLYWGYLIVLWLFHLGRSCTVVVLTCTVVFWCDFDRASSLICGNKMPTRCNTGFYCRSYCLLNMFRAPLCPSSGAQEYYTVVAACGISCCGFQVSGLVCRMLQHPANRTHNPQLHTRPATWKPQHEIPQAATTV